jgi:hypothetical protein
MCMETSIFYYKNGGYTEFVTLRTLKMIYQNVPLYVIHVNVFIRICFSDLLESMLLNMILQ